MFHQGGVLLGGLVHVRHRLAHLGHAVGLLAAGGADFAHDVGDAANRAHHFAHGGACAVGQLRALFHALHAVGDELADFSCCVARALCQVAHFTGHHGKAPALLASARGLDGGVECQDVGLKGDGVNHLNDVGNFAARFVDAAHGLHHFTDDLTALRRHGAGTGSQLVGLGGVVSVLAHGGTQLFHGGGGLL